MVIKLKFKPIFIMLTLTVVVAMIIFFINGLLMKLPNYEIILSESAWIIADLAHVPQFLIPFIIIFYITKGRLSRYGFNMKQNPPEFSHRRMLMIGLIFGLFMSIKFIIQIVNGLPLDVPEPVTLINILGYFTFQWIIVGLSEETMFRGLIQTYLMEKLEGEIYLVGHEFHIGTVISAIFWGGFHIINIINMPLSAALFTVIITTPVGFLMGYAYQRTGSLLTTILIHNTIFGVPLTIGYILYFMGY